MSRAGPTLGAPPAVGGPAPPPAFAGGEADRAGLLAAPLRGRPANARLRRPLTDLRGVGDKIAASAARIGIGTIGDLIGHFPHDWIDRSIVTPIAGLVPGRTATVLAEVRSSRLRPTRRRNLRIVEARVTDGSGTLDVVWFNQAWVADRLKPGLRILLSGSSDGRSFRPEAFEVLADEAAPTGGADPIRDAPGPPPGLHTTGIVPVHPSGEGLRVQRLREWVWSALALAPAVIEPLPGELRARHGFAAAADARIAIHFPRRREDVGPARARLAYEELFLHQAALQLRRGERQSGLPAPALAGPGELVSAWIDALPFAPTNDQRSAFAAIDADVAEQRPMQRLLMGEVGSGKTVVALYAMLRALEAGRQAVMMAPTETLAEQHFATLEGLLAGFPTPIGLLTGSTPGARRRELLDRLASGELPLVVGTHALIEPSVRFASLAVAVVDEQHRFGVDQRRALDRKGGEAPHVLHMTATPIPRTLSLTAFGDLDVTTLRELPAGRRPIRTWLVGEERREGAYDFIRDRLREGRQAYVVCPLVTDSEKDQAKAATTEAERLAAGEFRDFEVEVLHGQMPAAEKARAMARFAAGEADVLVATSVIEVGIDVANASVMLVEGADRYGLSQLHQLRGRIGRGEHESQCILFADPEGERARARLDALVRERDGFELAEIDLSLRGEGEVLGTRQSGLPRFRIAELPEDATILAAARRDLIAILDRIGSIEAPELGPLAAAVRERFGDERAEPIAA
ncbi:MAG: ATP-dependent DNA helicase RecG [Solirubrobacterales bacterium]|nr:ATP-dependent DNA helicase RecG [Solirubrobacterales bacterium]